MNTCQLHEAMEHVRFLILKIPTEMNSTKIPSETELKKFLTIMIDTDALKSEKEGKKTLTLKKYNRLYIYIYI